MTLYGPKTKFLESIKIQNNFHTQQYYLLLKKMHVMR